MCNTIRRPKLQDETSNAEPKKLETEGGEETCYPTNKGRSDRHPFGSLHSRTRPGQDIRHQSWVNSRRRSPLVKEFEAKRLQTNVCVSRWDDDTPAPVEGEETGRRRVLRVPSAGDTEESLLLILTVRTQLLWRGGVPWRLLSTCTNLKVPSVNSCPVRSQAVRMTSPPF